HFFGRRATPQRRVPKISNEGDPGKGSNNKKICPDPGSRIRIKPRGCARSREIICYSQQRRRDTAERRIGEPRENDSPPRLPGTTACRTHQLADDQRSQSWASSPGSEPARTPPSCSPPS